MVTRVTPFGRLTFDRDAIVRAALRAHVEGVITLLPNCLSFPAALDGGVWWGNIQQGAFYNGNGCGDNEVIAWTEAGIVGLAYELGAGPIEQLGLTWETVTGGIEDVRGAVPGLPAELEPAFVVAGRILHTNADIHNGVFYRERLAGVGFWLYGDRVGGLLFDDPSARGGDRLAAWGLLSRGRLLSLSCEPFYYPEAGKIVVDHARPQDLPLHAVIDAVTDRAWKGPIEFTPDELAIICPTPPEPKRLVYARYRLQQVGIRWPGLPDVLEEPPHPG